MSSVLSPALPQRPTAWYETLAALPETAFWRCFGWVMGLMSWNTFWGLEDTVVRDYDEGRYGVAASEMLHSQSQLVTTYAGTTEYWNLKPPLGYWLLELSYTLFGETPFSLRVPGAVSAMVTTALVMLFTRQIAGAREAILAGLYLGTSFGYLGHYGARSGELDVPLTLLLFIMLMLARQLSVSRAARLGMGLVLSLAFLLKSFAVLPYLAAVATYTLISQRLNFRRAWLAPICIAIFVVVVWVVSRTVAEGSDEFVRRMFVEDLFLRSTTAIDPGTASVWDYVGALFDRFAPWPLVVLGALGLSYRFAERRVSADSAALLWCYSLIPLALFTLARTHHSHYILPLYPAWAILGSVATLEVLERARTVQWGDTVAKFLIVCVLGCEARIVAHIAVHDRMPQSQRFLGSLRWLTGAHPRLCINFAPSHSERFFLQAVDGFELLQTPKDAPCRSGSGMVLQRAERVASPETVVLAESDGYVLARTF